MSELLAAEAGAVVTRSPAGLHEVGNDVVALERGIARLGKIPICVRLVRELHKELMTGCYRRCAPIEHCVYDGPTSDPAA